MAGCPKRGLQQILVTLCQAMEVDEGREDYARNRVLPFVRRLWPKRKEKITEPVSAGFARLCLVADEGFAEVFREVRPYLEAKGRHPLGHLLRSVVQRGYAKRFPEEALEFLHRVLGGGSGFLEEDLKSCLRSIRSARGELEKTATFQSLLARAGGTLA